MVMLPQRGLLEQQTNPSATENDTFCNKAVAMPHPLQVTLLYMKTLDSPPKHDKNYLADCCIFMTM